MMMTTMYKKSSVFLLICATLLFYGFHAIKSVSKTKWLGVEKVSELYKVEQRPIIIDLYTDWCHYCKVMDETAYANDSFANYVSIHFYAAKLNAEDKNDLVWMGKKYKYVPRYKVHELAIELTKGNMVYPTTIIIPPTGEPMVVGGAMPIYRLESILKYYGSGSYKSTSYEDFNKLFSSKW